MNPMSVMDRFTSVFFFGSGALDPPDAVPPEEDSVGNDVVVPDPPPPWTPADGCNDVIGDDDAASESPRSRLVSVPNDASPPVPTPPRGGPIGPGLFPD